MADFNEHDAVVRYLIEANDARYKVLSNLEEKKHHVAGMFPDILLRDKADKNLLFIMEVKRNGEIGLCIQLWKTIKPLPAVLYIIVPESDLDNAKANAQLAGLPAKFGTYSVNPITQQVAVRYER
jgi:hypothetical protein